MIETPSDKDIREMKELFLAAFSSWNGRRDNPALRNEIQKTVTDLLQKARVKKLIPLEFKPFRIKVFPHPDNKNSLIFDGDDDYTTKCIEQIWYLFNAVDDPNRYKEEPH